jgi:hypothetical protein
VDDPIAKMKARFLEQQARRRRTTPVIDGRVTEDFRHREYKPTWQGIGSTPKGPMYLKIFYCPDCLWGFVTDITYEHPDVEDARTLGIIRKKDWSRLCPVREKEARERGEQTKMGLPPDA